jgi:hypothetical protein
VLFRFEEEHGRDLHALERMRAVLYPLDMTPAVCQLRYRRTPPSLSKQPRHLEQSTSSARGRIGSEDRSPFIALYQALTTPIADECASLPMPSCLSISLRGAHASLWGPARKRSCFVLARRLPVRHIFMRSDVDALQSSYCRVAMRGRLCVAVQSVVLSRDYAVLCGTCRWRFSMHHGGLRRH